MLYLKKIKNATEEEKKTDVYKWARLISARDWEVLSEMTGTDEYIDAVMEEMNKINRDPHLRYLYLMRELADHDEASIRNFYTNKGIEEGRAEGERRGALIKLISQIRRKQQKGISSESAAEMLEENPQLVQSVYQRLVEYPNYTDEEIWNTLEL